MLDCNKGSTWTSRSCLPSCSHFIRWPSWKSCCFVPQSQTPLGSSLNIRRLCLSLLPTCYFLKEKKNPGPINHYSSEAETMVPPVWLPFFRSTLIFIHVHIYSTQIHAALGVVPWGSQGRFDIVGDIRLGACRSRSSANRVGNEPKR